MGVTTKCILGIYDEFILFFLFLNFLFEFLFRPFLLLVCLLFLFCFNSLAIVGKCLIFLNVFCNCLVNVFTSSNSVICCSNFVTLLRKKMNSSYAELMFLPEIIILKHISMYDFATIHHLIDNHDIIIVFF